MERQFLVKVRQNVTACDVYVGGPTQRTMSEHLFNNEKDAEDFYNRQKTMLKFAGLAGQYVTWPTEVHDYKVATYFCDHCGNGFENESYTELKGNFCSRECFRNDFQTSQEDSEDYYGEDY